MSSGLGSLERAFDEGRRLFKFGLVGGGGFFVDVSVLSICVIAGMGPLGGRVVSFLSAATFTWYWNRNFTFRDCRSDRAGTEWLFFLAVNCIGGMVNFFSYALMIEMVDTVYKWPQLGVIVGSALGLVFNYLGSRWIVFRNSG